MSIDDKYPALSDIKKRAKKRLPYFAWEYLDSATGEEKGKLRNRAALDAILFNTQILRGEINPDLKTTFLGQDYSVPFGVAPIGMSGMIWPGAEKMLAQGCVDKNLPYSISTVSTVLPETIAPYIGDNGWFQLYPPTDPEVRRDMLKRIKAAGFKTLVLTVDVPIASRRERQRRAELTIPPRKTPKMIWQTITHPTWALGTLANGIPRLRFAESYANIDSSAPSTAHAGYIIRGKPNWNYFEDLKSEWGGPIIVKGVTTPQDAKALKTVGVDAIWVSNHSSRQFDAGPASISTLAPIRAAVGPDMPIIFDSGVESGLDILRAIAHGANFVMLGRAFHYALAAFGARGFDHMVHVLSDDMVINMGQMGIDSLEMATDCLVEKIEK